MYLQISEGLKRRLIPETLQGYVPPLHNGE
jgi:hypothetical protein